MAISEHTSGEKHLETVIDFEPEKFKPTWDMVAHMLDLSVDNHPKKLCADAFDIPTEVILRCAIYRSAIDAFAETEMAGIDWCWEFYLGEPPVKQARHYASKNGKICIHSTACWSGMDYGEKGKFLWVNIGDFKISPIEE